MAKIRTLYFSGTMMVLGALVLTVVGFSFRNLQGDTRSGASSLGRGYLPQGSVDGVNSQLCQLRGWAADLDDPSANLKISVFLDGPRFEETSSLRGGTELGSFVANIQRPDVNELIQIGGNHGFIIDLASNSSMTKDQQEHKIYVYALDAGTENEYTLITKKPITLLCR